jgi:hypothetical protein
MESVASNGHSKQNQNQILSGFEIALFWNLKWGGLWQDSDQSNVYPSSTA